MVKHASMFSQLIVMIDRKKFHELVYRHKSERFAKKFNSWEHVVSMLFCQLAQAKSLRELCGGIACCTGKMKHHNDYKLFASWAESGIYFVTRLKDNADYEGVENFKIPQNRKVFSDSQVEKSGRPNKKGHR